MNKNKRDVLKGLAVGSVWATPVVSSVVLPVHAQTSGCLYSGVAIASNQDSDIYVCAVVDGDSAIVTHEAFNSGTSCRCVTRRGELMLDGSAGGTMDCYATFNTCKCSKDIPATLEIVGDSLRYTLERTNGGTQATTDLVITLNCVDICLQPTGPDCDSGPTAPPDTILG